jgi:hypothetical protein
MKRKPLSHNALKLILFAIITLTLIGLIVLIYNIYQWVNSNNTNPREFIITSKQQFNDINNSYNHLKTEFDKTYRSEKLDLTQSTTDLENQVYDLKHDIANLLDQLYAKKTFESEFNKEITQYLERMYNDPEITYENYKVYLHYMAFSQTQKDFNAEFKTKATSISTVSELNIAQGIISAYLPQFIKIRDSLNLVNTNPAFDELNTNIKTYLNNEIDYLTSMRNYYNNLSLAISKNLKDQTQPIINNIVALNQEFAKTAPQNQNTIKTLWEKFSSDEYTFTMESYKARSQIDKLYDTLSSKYKI